MVMITRRDFWTEVDLDGLMVFRGENITPLDLIKALNIEDCPPNLMNIGNPYEFLKMLNIKFQFRWDVQN